MNANDKMRNELEQLKARAAELEIAMNVLPDLGDCDGFLSDLCFQVDIPYNLVSANEYIAKMEAAGWSVVTRYNRQYAGDAVIVFSYPGIQRKFSLMLRPDYAGSTCKRNIISYDKQPVYEIICNNAPE